MQVVHIPLQQLRQSDTRRRCLLCATVDFVTTIENGLYTCPFCLSGTGVEHILPGGAWMCGTCHIPFRRGPSHAENTFKALLPQAYLFEGQTYNGVPQFTTVEDAARLFPTFTVDQWDVLGDVTSFICDPDDMVLLGDETYPSDDEERVALLTVQSGQHDAPVSGGKVLKWVGHLTRYFGAQPEKLLDYTLKVIEDQQVDLVEHLLQTFPKYFIELPRQKQDRIISGTIEADNYVLYKRFTDLYKIVFDLVQLDGEGNERAAYQNTAYRISQITKFDKVSLLHGVFGVAPQRMFPIGLFVEAQTQKPYSKCAQYLFTHAMPQVFKQTMVNLHWFDTTVGVEGELVLRLKTPPKEEKKQGITFTQGPHIYKD